MARTGRPPKPTALKRLEGTIRKDRMLVDEWQPPPGAPEVPEHLDGMALSKWQFLVGEMAKSGVLTQVDGGHLEGYCVQYARAVAADALVKKGGLTVKTPTNQLQVNPALSISRNAWHLVDVFGAKLGLSPSDRRHVSAGRKPVDRAERFLFPVQGGKK